MEYTFIQAKYFNRGWIQPPKLIVVHWVAGSFRSCIDTFKNGTRQASAHFVISKTGNVVQMVGLDFRAWHAGESISRFGKYANHYSYGIELEGPPSLVASNGWNPEQIKSLIEVCEYIKKEKPSVEYITNHSTISQGRKIDVKGSTGKSIDIFPWKEFMAKVSLAEL